MFTFSVNLIPRPLNNESSCDYQEHYNELKYFESKYKLKISRQNVLPEIDSQKFFEIGHFIPHTIDHQIRITLYIANTAIKQEQQSNNDVNCDPK